MDDLVASEDLISIPTEDDSMEAPTTMSPRLLLTKEFSAVNDIPGPLRYVVHVMDGDLRVAKLEPGSYADLKAMHAYLGEQIDKLRPL